MWFKISQIILRYRIAILIVIAGLTCMFGYFAATNVEVNTKFANTLSIDDPVRVVHEDFKRMFGEDGNIMVIGVEDVDLFKKDNFNAWYRLGEDIKKIDGIDSVFSIAHMYKLIANHDAKKFDLKLITKQEVENQTQMDSIKEVILAQRFYEDMLYKKSSNLSLMMVTVNAEKFNSLSRGKMITEIYSKTKEYQDYFPSLRYSGLPYIRDVVAETVKKEITITLGLAAFVTALIIFFFYRSIIVVLTCLVVVGVGVIWSFGFIGMFDFTLTMIMGLLPPLVIVIGIPNCTYLLNKYHAEYLAHGNKVKALTRVIQKIGNATFLTNTTTALGFGTFVFTNSFKMQQFGIVAFVNILAVFIISICLIPIIFSFLGPPKHRHTKHLEKRWVEASVNRLVNWVTYHRKWVFAVTIVVVGIAFYGLSQIITTGNVASDLPKGNPILADLKYFEKEFGGVMPFEVLVDAKKEGQVQRQEFVQRLNNVQLAVEKYRYEGKDIFSKSMSIADAIRYLNQAYADGDTASFNLGLFDLSKRDQLKIKKYLEGPVVQNWKRLRTQLISENDSLMLLGMQRYQDSSATFKPKYALSSLVNQDDSLVIYESDKILELSKEVYVLVDNQINELLNGNKNLAKTFVDSTGRYTRISFQIADIGSREMQFVEKDIDQLVDSVLNPFKDSLKYFLKGFRGAENRADRLAIAQAFFTSPSMDDELSNPKWQIEQAISKMDSSLADQLYEDSSFVYTLVESKNFNTAVSDLIESNIYDYKLTGTSVVFARETNFLVQNLLVSLAIAVVIIALLMSLLFSSVKMVLISLVPNFIPLLTTAGIMGLTGIPIKPSTALVFSVAFGISIDDTIHYLAKYRQELKTHSWNIKDSVINALKETGVSMIYTSIVLFFGFSVFSNSEFGGTVALGVLVSATLLVAMLSNLVVLPSLLLWLDKRITNKAFKEPFLELFDEESDIELEDLEVVKVEEPELKVE